MFPALRQFLVVLVALTLTVAAAPGSVFAHGAPGANAPGQSVSAAARAQAEQLTLGLANLNAQYHLAAAGQRAGLEAQMLQLAITREQALAAMLEDDPAEFLRVALPSSIRVGLPSAVQAHTEEDTDVDGTLTVLHQDDASGGRYLYHLDTLLGRLELRFAAEEPDQYVTGARIRAQGVRLNNVLALSSGTTSTQALSSGLTNTFGAQKTLVILVNFTDKATQPYTPSVAQSVFFTTTSNYFLENSYGQTSLTGDVAGWFTIAMSYTVCDYTTLANLAKQAATAAGFTLGNYSRFVYTFPSNACGWWGLSYVGGNPSQSWVNGSLQLAVTGHELGHALGLYHSHRLYCGDQVSTGTCQTIEYGDTFDLMGASYSNHYNAFQKERLGWLGYGASPPIATITSSQTLTLGPYETTGTDVKAAKILQNSSTKSYYYLEYRQPIGTDAYDLNNPNRQIQTGIMLHIGTPGNGNSSLQLSMTPQTGTYYDYDPGVTVGQTYADANVGVTVSPLWMSATDAGVSISFGAQQCVPGMPTIAISPSQSQWVQAGATVPFTITVTNNDNSACAASTFNLQAAIPSGWTAALSAGTVSVAPGASGSATVNVTSPTSAADGYYTITVTATDAANATRAATAAATYVISTATTSLGDSVSTNQTTYTRGQAVTITTTVQTNGAPVSGATVTVTVTRSNGSKANLAATTGTNGVAVVKYQVKKQDPTGTYNVLSKAAVSTTSATASTTFAVQ
jgi:hypothetical protein